MAAFSRIVIVCLVIPVAWLSCSAQALEQPARLKLVRALARSVVGVNSAVLKSREPLLPVTSQGSGAGFVVDEHGHVATLRSVLADIHAVEVILNDGTTWPALFKGEDRETGIAVLEIQAPDNVLNQLKGVDFAAGGVLAGQDGLVLGRTAGGEQLMVAGGLVACGGQTLLSVDGVMLYDVIVLDRTVAPVLEGGGLFDASGRLLGLMANSLIKTGQNDVHADFALPAATVKWVAGEIIATGKVRRTWLGADVVTVSPALARFLGLPVAHGVLVTSVAPDGPADRAGIHGSRKTLRLGNRVYPVGGDIITGLGKSKIGTDADLVRKLREFKPGDKTLITLYRGNRRVRLKVVLGEH